MDSYRQSQPAVGLSIERMTPGVPDDGYYYVVLQGEVQGRFRGLKQALAQYKGFLKTSGWVPPPVEKKNAEPITEAVERYMDQLQDYWSSSHQHRRPGAKRA